jgi:hypothetical protein
MQNNHEQPRPIATLAEVRATAEALLARLSGPEMEETDLFPHGLTRVSVQVRAGEVEIALEVEGPEHAQDEDEEEDEDDWDLEDELDEKE